MAKVKIQGHASGTGILTVTAPNTSTDRTITLPDATGTLATTADTFDPDGAVTINESGADVDFRVESDTDANALFVQGSSGKVGFGLEPTMGQVNIKTTGTFTTAYTDANGTGISMYSTDTAGDGKYGAAITWGALGGVNSHQAALTSIQTGSDANQVGLAMLTHNSTTGSAAMTEAIRVAHGGVMSVPNGIELGSGLDATAANTLDDYEEGTFTPTLDDASGNPIAGSQSGYYTKIGRNVTFEINLSVNDHSGTTGANEAQVNGLPFAVAATIYSPHTTSCGAMASDMGDGVIFQIFPSTSYGRFYKDNWNTNSHVSVKIQDFGTNGFVRISGTYMS